MRNVFDILVVLFLCIILSNEFNVDWEGGRYLKNIKIDIYKILIAVFSISLIMIFATSLKQSNRLKIDAEGSVHIDAIGSGIQRIAKLELEGNNDDALLEELYDLTLEIMPNEGESIYFQGDNEEVKQAVELYIEEFKKFALVVVDFRESQTRDTLFAESERHYELSSAISKVISDYIDDVTKFKDMLESFTIVNVLLVAVILVIILAKTLKELNHNKELSKDMYIDSSTGIYNRAKCQEVLKTPINVNDKNERAIVIFDLNDLKKTNDLHGHRAGDDLIATFAGKLKEATNISSDEIFVGRYGGDEFIAFFASCQEKDVEVYLKEVDYVMETFNEKGDKPFKLSCAAGYSITTPQTKSRSMRELFDEADVNMYNNKIAMKEKKKQELLAQGIEVEEHVDDRL